MELNEINLQTTDDNKNQFAIYDENIFSFDSFEAAKKKQKDPEDDFDDEDKDDDFEDGDYKDDFLKN